MIGDSPMVSFLLIGGSRGEDRGFCPPWKINLFVLMFGEILCFEHLKLDLQIRVYNQKNIFFISGPKHMLWVLKRTVSMRRFF